MSFKRNEPGCRCCGYGLSGNLRGPGSPAGSDRINVLVPSREGGLAISKAYTTYNAVNTLGAGVRTIGMDPERGRLLLQQPDGDIYYLEAKTHATGLLWSSSTDVGSREIQYLYYQHSYGYAGGYTTVADSSECFSIDNSGAFHTAPFAFPSGPNITVTFHSVAVDPSGNVYCGVKNDRTGLADNELGPIYFLQNGNEFCYGMDFVSANPLPGAIRPVSNLIVARSTDLYTSVWKQPGLGFSYTDYVMKTTGAVEIESSDALFSISGDVVGRVFSPSPEGWYMCGFNALTNLIDINTLSGWFRVSEDLNTLVVIADNFNNHDVLVTYPGV